MATNVPYPTICSLLLMASFCIFCLAENQSLTLEEFENEDSRFIKDMLGYYDASYRPRPGDISEPVIVNVNMYIRLININDGVKDGEVPSMTLSMTLREKWLDQRLDYSKYLNDRQQGPNYLNIPNNLNIWFPDTFFQNEYDSTPIVRDQLDRLVRVYPHGALLMSQRLQHRFSCPSNLYWYPYDITTCNVDLASYSYTTDDLDYIWKFQQPIQLKQGIAMPEFNIIEFRTGSCTSKTNTGEYGCLRATISLTRKSEAQHLFELFFCPGILVALSWVGFLLPHWKKNGIGLLVIVFLTFIVTVEMTYNNFPQTRYSFVHTWISGCGYFITAEIIFLVLLKLAHDFFHAENPVSNQSVEKKGGLLIAGVKSIRQRLDIWAIIRLVGVIIFCIAFLIYAIVTRASIQSGF